MKTIQIIFLVVGASVLTFIISVVFSINMVSISPKNLAKVVKDDPETFMEAVKEASISYQKTMTEKALENQFKNPAKIPTKGRVTFGPSEAPITIVEYSDFQCPYCSRAASRMKVLIEKYKGKIKLVYKHFPLSFHPLAKPAAEYFEAVAMIDHEKARKFHDEIFDNFQDYAKLKTDKEITRSLGKILRKLDLSLSDLNKHMDKAKKIVKEDMEEALKLNVRGTPSFFVNGVKPQQGQIEPIIEKFLKEM